MSSNYSPPAAAIIVVVIYIALCSPLARAAPPGWRLMWSDEFNAFDPEKWERMRSEDATVNSQQAYLPDQVSVDGGKLVILSENGDAAGMPYRSGRVISKHAQRQGRWEIRARIPTGRGLRSTVQLLPERTSNSPYEIDIMANRGDRPTITASACLWGPRGASSDNQIVLEQQTSLAGKMVSYPEDFHTYAMEWVDDQLRFYVDDVYHAVLYSDEVGGFFSKHMEPMRLAIGTAIGDDALPSPDDTTAWPQRFLVDWVRVYQRSEAPATHALLNGSFEENGGTLAGWHVFGNRVDQEPNVLVHRQAVKNGNASLKLFGPLAGESYSGLSQGISVQGGQHVRARLAALVRSSDSLARTENRVFMKIEFYNKWGDYFGGPAMLGFEERLIADHRTPGDSWTDHEIVAQIPQGAVEARLSIVFAQKANEPGSSHIDAVEFAVVKQ